MKNKKAKIESLTRLMSKQDLEQPFKSASIVNENEQPIILTSNDTFENHEINLGNGMSFGCPDKMIPYLIESLTKLYHQNLNTYLKGDNKKIVEHLKKFAKDNKIEYFDLNHCDDSFPNRGTDVVSEINDLLKTPSEALKDLRGDIDEQRVIALSPKEGMELIREFEEMKDIAKDAESKIRSGELTKEEMAQLKKETNEKMMENIKSIELKLTGKVSNAKEDFGLEKIKRTFEKYGAKAAEEELRRIPVDQRDAIMREMVNFKKK